MPSAASSLETAVESVSPQHFVSSFSRHTGLFTPSLSANGSLEFRSKVSSPCRGEGDGHKNTDTLFLVRHETSRGVPGKNRHKSEITATAYTLFVVQVAHRILLLTTEYMELAKQFRAPMIAVKGVSAPCAYIFLSHMLGLNCAELDPRRANIILVISACIAVAFNGARPLA